MEFLIKCDVFKRLAAITKHFETTTDEETRQVLSCVRLEYKDGRYCAVATNQRIAAIQYLGETDQPDGAAHIINDDTILKQCDVEMQYDSSFHITALPEFAVTTVRSLMGWEFTGNAGIFPTNTPMDTWRKWFPDSPVTKGRGVMYWNADQIAALAATAPSGKLYFPRHIDIDKPVIIRDLLDDSWCGLFMPKPHATEKQVDEQAELPKWL